MKAGRQKQHFATVHSGGETTSSFEEGKSVVAVVVVAAAAVVKHASGSPTLERPRKPRPVDGRRNAVRIPDVDGVDDLGIPVCACVRVRVCLVCVLSVRAECVCLVCVRSVCLVCASVLCVLSVLSVLSECVCVFVQHTEQATWQYSIPAGHTVLTAATFGWRKKPPRASARS